MHKTSYARYSDSLESILREFVLHMKYTFGSAVHYIGTTTKFDGDIKRIRDVDIIVVLSHFSEGHLTYIWRIINKLHHKYNLFLDVRFYSIEQLSDSSRIPLINKYLLSIFLADFLGTNPFRDFPVSIDVIKEEGLKRIAEQENKILTIMPHAVGASNQLRVIAQSVYDAIRAFLIINDQPIADKQSASVYFSKTFPEFSEVTAIYEGYLDPNSILDVGGFILDSMAIVKHLLYKAQNKMISNEILLINTPSSITPHPRDDYLSYDHNMPLGLVCLSSYLERYNYRINILDSYAENLGVLSTVDNIFTKDNIPRIIGFNSSSPNIHIVHKIASYIKRIRKDLITVCGGPHASLATQHTLSTGDIDYVVKGEGELSFLRLVKSILDHSDVEKSKKIPGVFSLDFGHVQGEENTELLDLVTIPTPNFRHLPIERYFNVRKRIYIHTSRGCFFNCIYCSVPTCWGKKVREIPINLLIDHIDELVRLYHPDEVQIVDDNFSHKQGKLIDAFCEGLSNKGLTFKWKCQARADQLNAMLVTKMAATGCFEVDFGIESGNTGIQKYIRKNLDLVKTAEIISIVNGHGIFTKAFFMLGFPEESYQQISDTINYSIQLKKTGLQDVAFFPVMPFPGTEISKITGKEVFQGAIIDDIDIYERSFAAHRLRKYSAKPEISLNSNFSPDDLRLLVKFAYQRFNFGAQVINLEDELKQFITMEERNIYGI